MSSSSFDGADLDEAAVDARDADLQSIYGDNGMNEQDAMLDTSWSPPERKPFDVFEPESIDQRLTCEEPEVWSADDGDGIGDQADGEGEPDSENVSEVGQRRAGRLVAPDEGSRGDDEAELYASDVGIDGGAASAEEAAMHVISDDEDENWE